MSDFLTLKRGRSGCRRSAGGHLRLPFGHVVSQKGEFDVDEESLAAMKAQIAERGVDLVVDYEHQTLTGDRAPAAGWVKELFAEDGHIKARVEWTLPAKQYLENKEYRYLSPVITVRKSDNKATGLHSLALTNTPAIAGMTPIVNSSTFEGGKTNMNELIKKLAAALGLGGRRGRGADPRGALRLHRGEQSPQGSRRGQEARDGKQPPEEDTVVANKAVCELLGLKAGAPAAEVAAVIMSLKGGIDGRVKALEEQLADRDAEEAVELALKSGKITPAQKEWAKGYALKSPDGFKSFLEKAPQVVPMSEVAGGETLALKGKKPDEATMLICKQLGVSAEDLEKVRHEGGVTSWQH